MLAVTENVYSVFAVSSVTLAPVPDSVIVPEPVTLYPVTVPHPLGSSQSNVAVVAPVAEPLRLRDGQGVVTATVSEGLDPEA